MPRLMLCLLIAALPFAAAAQTTGSIATASAATESSATDTDATVADPNAPMQVTATGEEATVADADKDKALDHFCLQHTGTLITARKATAARRCAGIGRSYSQDDIRRTGETDIADALRRLDASIY